MSFLSVGIVVFVLLGGFKTAANSHERPELRVLALGDSITAGGFNSRGVWNVGPGYRWDLAQMASWIGTRLHFVGRLNDGPNPETQAHEGHSGKRVEEIQTLVQSQVARLAPDVILLMVGTNDIIQGFDLSGLPRRILKFVEALQREAPAAYILVAVPPPTNNFLFNQRLRTLESALALTPISRSRVKILNFFRRAKLSHLDLTDGVHMGPSGNKKLADHWAKGLRCVLRNLDCGYL